jgi:hypothetical protein
MYNVQGHAYRTPFGIYVSLAGLLANSCMEAAISGTYPGSIIHIVDPGHAEIFIEERTRPGSQICLMHLVPWYAQAMLYDSTHNKVAIYVNGEQKLMLSVEPQAALKRADSNKDWIVTALAGSPKDGPFLDCVTHHKDDIVLAIYAKVFGPDTRAACEAFRAKSCGKLAL